MEIFEQTMIFDDPRFEGIDFDGAPSLFGIGALDDDFNEGMGGKLNWKPKQFSSVWKPQNVVGSLRSYVDLTRISIRHPVYSERAVKVLRDFLSRSGELLPIKTVAGTYYVLNIQHISDAIDRQRSRIAFPSSGSPKETAFGIDYHVFDPNKLKDHGIFRVRECPQHIYTTDAYKSLVEASALNGFCFNKVWPLDEGVDWRQLAARQARLRSQEVTRLNGQSLTIALAVAGAEPTQQEIAQGYRLAEQVAELLANSQQDISGNYLGGIESTGVVKKELRINLSGPDSQKIFATIELWLKQIDWSNSVDVVLWKGNRNDKKTDKIRVKIKQFAKKK